MTTSKTVEVSPKRKCRLWRIWSGISLAYVGLYVASIGPLAGLEVRYSESWRLWDRLKVVYAPVLWSWKYGPDWWATALGSYTACFHTPQTCGPHLARYVFATHNKPQAYRYMKKWYEGNGVREPELTRRLQEFEGRGL